MDVAASSRIKLLAVDDDPSFLGLVSAALANQHLHILTAGNGAEAMQAFYNERPRIVLLDLVMPDVGGIALLEQMLAADPGTEVILITGNYSTESAVESIQKGACDYLPKPVEMERLRSRVSGLILEAENRKRTLQLDHELMDAYQFEGIIGRSPLMLELFARLRRVSAHFQTVLVTGQTGTGKELVARALHHLSPANSGPFSVCNCSAIVQTLLESELFGHVRGAFTGASQDKVGVFEHANGGIVFLDEIGELPMEAQAKLLRVLQNHEVQRVGSPVPKKVDVRIVAATNRDLRRMMYEGKFREDLYYRIATVELKLPCLADRKEDLSLLQRYFVSQYAALYGRAITGITRRAQICLARHSWPGNVRELENAIGNACMMAEGNVIDVMDLPESVRAHTDYRQNRRSGLLTFAELQNRHLLHVLHELHGNKARAAEVLGVSRTTIYEMLAKLDSSSKFETDHNAAKAVSSH